MRLSERIKALRERHGWTQETLGEVSQVRIATLSSIESGHNTDPRWSHLARIARAFDLTVEELVADVEDIAHRWPAGTVASGILAVPEKFADAKVNTFSAGGV